MEKHAYKTVFVTGAAGFVGSAVVDELLTRGYGVHALVHRGTLKQEADEHVTVIHGDLFNAAALDKGIDGTDAIIHLVGIIRETPQQDITFERIHVEGAKNVMERAKRVGVRRFVHMSALGARADAVSNYHKTKFAAEQALRESGLEATIFRPSLIHGPGGEFLKMEADWARGKRPPFLFMPYFAPGLLGMGKGSLIQPVYVKDVARAFVTALDQTGTIGQTYCMGGAEKLTWPQMHHVAAEVFAGKKKPAVGVPAWYAKLLTHIAPAKLLPFTRDQVIMAQEDSICDMSGFVADLGWEPGGFASTLKEYAASVS